MPTIHQNGHLSKADRRVFALFVAQKLASHCYPAEQKRLERAMNIALYPEQMQRKSATQTLVHSQAHGDMWFLVEQQGPEFVCNCPDQGPVCKHILSVQLAKRARCLMTKQYVATDMKDEALGIATQVQLGEEEGFVFQPLDSPDPHYVPRWRLLLHSHCCIDACTDAA